MKISYYGHSCFSVLVGGKNLLFDPFISPNALASAIDIDLIEADYIFLSHGHEDHVADAEVIAKRTGAKIVAPYEVVMWYAAKGLENGQPLNHGGSWQFDFGKVKMTAAVHSSVLPDGTYGGNPAGFVIETAEGNFYYSGDTALTMDMQLIPVTSKPLDLALLPIGDCFTMGVNDALLAAEFVRCDKIIGLHYDTFPLIEIDHEDAKKIFKEKGKELILMDVGEIVDLS